MSKIIVETRETTIFCTPQNDNFSCRVYENERGPFKDEIRPGVVVTSFEGDVVKVSPTKEFDTKSLKFIGPFEILSDTRHSSLHIDSFRGRFERPKYIG